MSLDGECHAGFYRFLFSSHFLYLFLSLSYLCFSLSFFLLGNADICWNESDVFKNEIDWTLVKSDVGGLKMSSVGSWGILYLLVFTVGEGISLELRCQLSGIFSWSSLKETIAWESVTAVISFGWSLNSWNLVISCSFLKLFLVLPVWR